MITKAKFTGRDRFAGYQLELQVLEGPDQDKFIWLDIADVGDECPFTGVITVVYENPDSPVYFLPKTSEELEEILAQHDYLCLDNEPERESLLRALGDCPKFREIIEKHECLCLDDPGDRLTLLRELTK